MNILPWSHGDGSATEILYSPRSGHVMHVSTASIASTTASIASTAHHMIPVAGLATNALDRIGIRIRFHCQSSRYVTCTEISSCGSYDLSIRRQQPFRLDQRRYPLDLTTSAYYTSLADSHRTFMLVARIRSSHLSVQVTGSTSFSSLTTPSPPAVPCASASVSCAVRVSKWRSWSGWSIQARRLCFG